MPSTIDVTFAYPWIDSDGTSYVPDQAATLDWATAWILLRDGWVRRDGATVVTPPALSAAAAAAIDTAATAAAGNEPRVKRAAQRPAQPMRTFWNAVEQNATNGGPTPVVAVWGDSTCCAWSRSTAFPLSSQMELLGDLLARQFGKGKRAPDGFQRVHDGTPSSLDDHWTTIAGTKANHGAGGGGVTMTGAGFCETTFTGDGVIVFGTKQKSVAGVCNVTVDGSAVATGVTMQDAAIAVGTQASGYPIATVTGLTDGTHTVRVTWVSGSVKLDGAQPLRGTGPYVSNFGHVGSAIADHQSNGGTTKYGTLDHILRNKPQCVIIGNGLIDWQSGGPAAYQASLIAAITAVQNGYGATPAPSIVVVFEYEPPPITGFAGWGATTEELARQIAVAYGCEFVSNYETLKVATEFVLPTDLTQLHLTQAGHQRMVDELGPKVTGSRPARGGGRRMDGPVTVQTGTGPAIGLDPTTGLGYYSTEARRVAGTTDAQVGGAFGNGIVSLGNGNGVVGIDADTVRVAKTIALDGITGANSTGRIIGHKSTAGAPASGTFKLRDVVIAQDGVWLCTVAGSPGTWINLGVSMGAASLPPSVLAPGSYSLGTGTVVFGNILNIPLVQMLSSGDTASRLTLYNGHAYYGPGGTIAPVTAAAPMRVANGNTGSTKTLDLTTQGDHMAWTLNASCVFTMPTAASYPGARFRVEIATGGASLTATFTGVKWPGGTAYVPSTASGARDLLEFWTDGTSWFGTVLGKAYA